MTEILDGPAAGAVLWLRRRPLYLRVVIDPAGEVDALDQLGDEPREGEALTAYRLVPGSRSWVHLCVCGKGKAGGGRYDTGQYRACPVQPTQETMRSTARWRAWCEDQWEIDRARAAEAAEGSAT